MPVGDTLEIVDERCYPVSDVWVVPDVAIANVPCNRLFWLALIEHQVIEGEHICLVLHQR